MHARQCCAAGPQLQRPFLPALPLGSAASRTLMRLPTQMQLLPMCIAAAAAGDSAISSSSSSSNSRSRWVRSPEAPWSLTFDLRERETEWTDANKVNTMLHQRSRAAIDSAGQLCCQQQFMDGDASSTAAGLWTPRHGCQWSCIKPGTAGVLGDGAGAGVITSVGCCSWCRAPWITECT
jgi:hypothetical protein